MLLLEVCSACAAVELVPDGPEPALFGDGKRTFRALFRNTGDSAIEAHLEFRLYQASASTLAPLGDLRTWRTVPLGAGQTIVESVEVELPTVRGETGFQVIWFDGRTKLGATSLRIFPDELLKPLAALGGDAPVGLIDPEGQFKTALATVRVQELKEAEDISAAETRLILILQEAGFILADEKSDRRADIEITGEAFSALGVRRGNLISCKARVELKAQSRADGKILAVDRETSVAVDIAEQSAAKTALQNAAAELASRLAPKLAGVLQEVRR